MSSLYNLVYTLVFADYVMGEAGCTLTILDVADLLQTKYAYVSGKPTARHSPTIQQRICKFI